jgi:hypothetical protein
MEVFMSSQSFDTFTQLFRRIGDEEVKQLCFEDFFD